MNFLSLIFGDANKRYLKKLQPILQKIGSLEQKFEKLSDADLKVESQELKERLKRGVALDDILSDAFALVREASKRTLNMRHFDMQILGGISLHQGKIAEMRTGEGKTLAATLPAYLNALIGKGVHVVTVNDYLSRRDTVWMGQIYDFLGLSVGCLNHEISFLYDSSFIKEESDRTRDLIGGFKVMHEFLRPVSRKEAYQADILYGTNNEFGFDYLRDNMAYDLAQTVQRGHHFAIVDEIDSILIDEARTPLIISAPDEESATMYGQFSKIVPVLKENVDYNVDEKLRAVTLTDDGITKVEKLLGIKNIYDTALGDVGLRYVHHLEQALKANILFKKDRDYVIKNDEIIIVDEFTGRLMPGRRYSEGLHQAIESKEGVRVQKESRTLATITFQNYFRMYEKLSGMTGTAITSAEEFHKVYGLDVVVIPTQKPMVRKDSKDQIYQTEIGKLTAIVKKIKELNKKGQPVLVGTVSIEKNEFLSSLLKKEGIFHEVLNAKNHEREAEIIAQAGRSEAVTVATNMAGRGVDIILGGNPQNEDDARKVREAAGLFVIGTERHEARRIDNQLRGRAGRQGDPGETQFFLSLEDDLMRVFGSDKIKKLMGRFGIPEDQPIENIMVSKAIESAQGKIEGFHFDARNYVLKYDEVMSKHRDVIYRLRKEILLLEDLKDKIMAMTREELDRIIIAHTAERNALDWNIEEINEDFKSIFGAKIDLAGQLRDLRDNAVLPDFEKMDKMLVLAMAKAEEIYDVKKTEYGNEAMKQAAKIIMLRTIDMFWVNHLENMDHLRDSVRLRAYGQHDPLAEYKNEGHRLYKELTGAIQNHTIHLIFKIHFEPGGGGVASKESPNVIEKYNKEVLAVGESAKKNLNLGRNDPCWCGSGKKYKKCHGA